MVVGIDVAKTDVVCVAMDRSGRVRSKYTVRNREEELTKFIENISAKYKRVIFASEATGQYHRLLALLCIERQIPFRLINPIVTKQFTRATVRKRKTDLTDAVIIAKLALSKEGRLVDMNSFLPVKQTVRTSTKLSQLIQTLVLMQQKLEMVGIEQKLLNELKTCQKQLQSSQKVFNRFSEESVNDKLKKLLMSIPGVGKSIATTLIAEIEDISRFKDGRSLVAYAGLDPKVKQSGGSLHHNTHLTKRGSPNLRRTLYLSASIAQRCDLELKTYYEKKRAEGKYYKEATVANARKLIYRVYAVWRRQTPYVPYTPA